MSARSRDGRSLLVTIPCAVAAAVLLLSQEHTLGRPLVIAMCGLAVLLSECFPLHFAVNGERHTATFVELPMVVGLVISPSPLLAVSLVLAILVSQMFRRLPPRKLAFNVAQYGLAAAVALDLATRIPGVTGVLLGIAAFTLVNELSVQLVLRLVAGLRMGVPYRGNGQLWMLHLSVSVSGGLVVGKALEYEPGLLLALVPPMLMMLSTQREALRRSMSEALQRSIADHALDARSFDRVSTLRLITDLTRDLLAAERAEVVLLDGARPLRCIRSSAGLDLQRMPENWLEQEPWFEACMSAGPHGDAKKHQATIVLPGDNGPKALLAAFRSAEDERLRDSDLPTLVAIAAAAGRWLDKVSESEHSPVLDLDAGRVHDGGLGQPRVLRLVHELDLLSARMGTEWASHLPELDQMQDLLMQSLVGGLSGSSSERRVALGSWEPILRGPS
jgi:hypothetical protein